MSLNFHGAIDVMEYFATNPVPVPWSAEIVATSGKFLGNGVYVLSRGIQSPVSIDPTNSDSEAG